MIIFICIGIYLCIGLLLADKGIREMKELREKNWKELDDSEKDLVESMEDTEKFVDPKFNLAIVCIIWSVCWIFFVLSDFYYKYIYKGED